MIETLNRHPKLAHWISVLAYAQTMPAQNWQAFLTELSAALETEHVEEVARLDELLKGVTPQPEAWPDAPPSEGEVDALVAEALRPIISPPREASPGKMEWEEIVSLFERNGLPPPPWRLRDVLVGHLVWARYGDRLASALSSRRATVGREGIYVASRASILARGEMWRAHRAAGVPIISTWIDEDGPNDTADLDELWVRIRREVVFAERLVLYVEPDDFPLKGAFVEIGMALAANVPITIVAPGVEINGRNCRPFGSWVRHPLVSFAPTVDEAFRAAADFMEAK